MVLLNFKSLWELCLVTGTVEFWAYTSSKFGFGHIDFIDSPGLASSQEADWKEQWWMHPCYFSGKEQILIPSSGSSIALRIADGAVLLSHWRMVAALQENIL